MKRTHRLVGVRQAFPLCSPGRVLRNGADDCWITPSRPGLSLAAVACCLVITALGLAPSKSAEAALIGNWKFDEGSLTTAADSSGNGYTGTLNAGGQGVPSTWVTGHAGTGSALDFKGFTDRVVVPIAASGGLTNTFSFTLWAKADFLGFYPFPMLFSNDANGSSRQFFFQGTNSGGDQMYIWSDPVAAWRKPLGFKEGGTGTANLNWHHYAFTYSGGVLRPYVDGLAKTTQTIAGSPNIPSFTHLLIGGKNQNFTSWEGPIDDVGLFSDAQSAQRIALIHGLGQPGLDVALNDTAIDAVLNVFNTQSGSALAGGVTFQYATGLPESTVGEIGGSLVGEDFYIVLGSDFDGGLGVQMVVAPATVPEPSTLVLAGCGLLGLLACAVRNRVARHS